MRDYLQRTLAIAFLALLTGCTSVMHASSRDPTIDFNHKIGSVYLVWRQNSTLPVNIVKHAGHKPQITEADRAESRSSLVQLLGVLANKSIETLSARFEQSGTQVVTSGAQAKTRLLL